MENQLENYLNTVLQRLEKATREILKTGAAGQEKPGSAHEKKASQGGRREDPRSSDRQAG